MIHNLYKSASRLKDCTILTIKMLIKLRKAVGSTFLLLMTPSPAISTSQLPLSYRRTNWKPRDKLTVYSTGLVTLVDCMMASASSAICYQSHLQPSRWILCLLRWWSALALLSQKRSRQKRTQNQNINSWLIKSLRTWLGAKYSNLEVSSCSRPAFAAGAATDTIPLGVATIVWLSRRTRKSIRSLTSFDWSRIWGFKWQQRSWLWVISSINSSTSFPTLSLKSKKEKKFPIAQVMEMRIVLMRISLCAQLSRWHEVRQFLINGWYNCSGARAKSSWVMSAKQQSVGVRIRCRGKRIRAISIIQGPTDIRSSKKQKSRKLSR